MNWAGELVQTQLDPEDVVLDLGCGIMQATLDTCPSYPPTKIQCKKIIGVDAYEPYLKFLVKKGIEVMKWDLRVIPLPFKDKSVDVILLLDVVEHLKCGEALALMDEAERIARKKVLVLIPQKFEQQVTKDVFPYEGFGENLLQRHQCLITKKMLKQIGYRTNFPTKAGGNKEKIPMIFAVKKLYLNILHVWDQAGVSGLMAYYQKNLGHHADIIKLKEFDDGIMGKYGFELIPFKLKTYPALPRVILRTLKRKWRSLTFYFAVKRIAKKYDILHIHSLWLCVFFTPFKKKIIEFHGDDVRKEPHLKKGLRRFSTSLFIYFYSKFHKLYVSTPDLLRDVPNSEWIPNPVDPLHFNKKLHEDYEPASAYYIHNWYEDGSHAQEFSSKYGLKLTIFDRTIKGNWILHEDFPKVLGLYEYFIDRKNIPSLSKTGLEALAMGLKVVQGWDGKILEGLESIHLPENVAARTIRIYKERLGWK